MIREGLFIGNKEVTKRYIGDKLIWEKFRLLSSETGLLSYSSNTREIDVGRISVPENVKAVEINGHKIEISKRRILYGGTRLRFVDSLEEFERKTGFSRTKYFYESINIKFYGV